jgi:hypothetical protein
VTKKRKEEYSGLLAEPLPPPTIGEVFGNRPSSQLAKLIAKKMRLLFAHYGIDENQPHAWMAIAFRLARQHVPGFKQRELFPKKAGRSRKWMGAAGEDLHADVWALVRNGESEAEACRILSETTTYMGDDPRSLLRRFKEVQAKHSKAGWSNDGVLAWVRLKRDPAALAAAVRSAYAEITSRNSA